MATKTPLGVIELESGSMDIYALDDLFLNFTFEDEENWEEFRLMMNILLDEYRRLNPMTVATLIEGAIHIETQYKFYTNAKKKNKTRKQDFKSDELEMNRLKYVEFQNKATSKPPIPDRAFEYFVLSIGNNPGKLAAPRSEEVKRIAQTFNTSFELFKDDKEVKNAMTIAEKHRNEGWVDGVEVGAEKGANAGANKVIELIKSGLSPDEALHKFNEESKVLVTSLVKSHA